MDDDAWTFDEDFVRGAPAREESAAERIARLRHVDAEHRRLLDEAATARRLARRRPRRRPNQTFGLVLLAALLSVWWIVGRSNGRPSGLLGTEPGAVFTFDGGTVEFPPPPADQATAPLGAPVAAPDGGGTYRFVQLQEGGDDPVAYDPCQPLHLVVNSRTAPAGGDALLVDAVSAVSAATGLRIVVDGPTDEVLAERRRPVQAERYGDRWAPVLMAWTDADELSDLGGLVAGSAGSMSVGDPRTGRRYFVTGAVALDGPQLADVLVRPGGYAEARAVVAHELAHLVGLDHVDDPSQLMNPVSTPGIVRFGSGDRTGLAALGRAACSPSL